MTTLAEFMAEGDDDGPVLGPCLGDECVIARQAENDLRGAVHRLTLKWEQDAGAWNRRANGDPVSDVEASYAAGFRDALQTAAVVAGRLLGE